MKKLIKILSIILCLTLALCAFAACGKEENKDDDKTTTKATTTTTTAPSTTEKTTTEAEGLIGSWSYKEPLIDETIDVYYVVEIEFKEDGTCITYEYEDGDIEAYKEFSKQEILDEMTEDEINEFLADEGYDSLDEWLDDICDDIFGKADAYEEEGTWEVKDGKLYTDGEELDYEIDGDTLTLSTDYDTLVLTRVK